MEGLKLHAGVHARDTAPGRHFQALAAPTLRDHVVFDSVLRCCELRGVMFWSQQFLFCFVVALLTP